MRLVRPLLTEATLYATYTNAKSTDLTLFYLIEDFAQIDRSYPELKRCEGEFDVWLSQMLEAPPKLKDLDAKVSKALLILQTSFFIIGGYLDKELLHIVKADYILDPLRIQEYLHRLDKVARKALYFQIDKNYEETKDVP
jgi:hypothetical protein